MVVARHERVQQRPARAPDRRAGRARGTSSSPRSRSRSGSRPSSASSVSPAFTTDRRAAPRGSSSRTARPSWYWPRNAISLRRSAGASSTMCWSCATSGGIVTSKIAASASAIDEEDQRERAAAPEPAALEPRDERIERADQHERDEQHDERRSTAGSRASTRRDRQRASRPACAARSRSAACAAVARRSPRRRYVTKLSREVRSARRRRSHRRSAPGADSPVERADRGDQLGGIARLGQERGGADPRRDLRRVRRARHQHERRRIGQRVACCARARRRRRAGRTRRRRSRRCRLRWSRRNASRIVDRDQHLMTCIAQAPTRADRAYLDPTRRGGYCPRCKRTAVTPYDATVRTFHDGLVGGFDLRFARSWPSVQPISLVSVIASWMRFGIDDRAADRQYR